MYKKQVEDARLAELQSDVRQNRINQHIADATERSTRRMEAAIVRHRAEEIRKQQKDRLQERRKALAELLDKDEKEHQEILKNQGTTADQRKERLVERAKELRRKREEEREKLARELQYRRWRESVDELRSSDAKLHGLQVWTLLATEELQPRPLR